MSTNGRQQRSSSRAAIGLGLEDIFHLQPIVQRFAVQRSAYTRDSRGHHLLCLADADDQLFLYEANAFASPEQEEQEAVAVGRRGGMPAQCDGAERCVRIVRWFADERKRVQAMCFDATGSMLLVLCYENTLHTVPITWVLDGRPSLQHPHLSGDKVTSYIVPFAGPHNCSNSKTCPNNAPTNITSTQKLQPATSSPSSGNPSPDAADASDSPSTDDSPLPQQWSPLADAYDDQIEPPISAASSPCDPCPYPTAVVWWQTLTDDQRQRAIVGYSDGTICIVGLEPHCPLVAHTCIDRPGAGAICEMVICRDSVLNNVTLMITAGSREQWKLMLEQKSIGYTYPGTESASGQAPGGAAPPSASSSRQSSKESHEPPPSMTAAGDGSGGGYDDWQIVVPLNKTLPEHEPPLHDLSSSCDPSPTPPLDAAAAAAVPGLLPSARARLVSLRELGAKKIGALKLKLAENRTTTPNGPAPTAIVGGSDAHRNASNGSNAFAILGAPPLLVPERLTTAGGPFFIVQQQLGGKCVLSALHEHSDTLSLHSIDVSPIPLCIYKVPAGTQLAVVTPLLMYTISRPAATTTTTATTTGGDQPGSYVCSVIGTGVAELRIGEEADLQARSMLGRFELRADERVVALYRMDEPLLQQQAVAAAAAAAAAAGGDVGGPVRSTDAAQLAATMNSNYVRQMQYMKRHPRQPPPSQPHQPPPPAAPRTEDERRLLRNDFPEPGCCDGCVLVTTHGAYRLEMRQSARATFCEIAKRGGWSVCEEFCRTFRLNFTQCVEFAGDEMLRQSDVRQALQCYNVARIPSVKTALKLAMFGENNALMHLCAMALKTVYLLRSTRPLSYLVEYMSGLQDARFVGSGEAAQLTAAQREEAAGVGLVCTDFSYAKDEAVTDLQMSNSSQFHLSNLLLLTLTERTIQDKRCMPLWNFLVSNKKYHPNMTSIVLCQSGLYYAAVLLACARGAHLDAYCGLVGVANQEFGWYNELNKILVNLAEPMFAECVIYMYAVSQDYFAVVQQRMEQIELPVMEKLLRQLDPFSPVFRPIVAQLDLNSTEVDPEFIAFCKSFIETFLLLLISIQSRRKQQLLAEHCSSAEQSSAVSSMSSNSNNNNSSDPSTVTDSTPASVSAASAASAAAFTNALSSMCGAQHEDTPMPIAVQRNHPLSAGFSHCACIVDGIAYAWGSNGVNCLLGATAQPETPDVYSTPRPLQFLGQINVAVHAVRCGRTHTLILTNNGLYSTGANQLGQLGIGAYTAQALQPMLVRAFDGRNIELLEAGQYHNAVVADGRLYTWGWGVYGQLGHGDVEICYEPRAVHYFADYRVQQMALGHAHTVLLVERRRSGGGDEQQVYVFGSNHYGQLGVGQPGGAAAGGEPQILKSLVPLRVDVGKSIRLIHTKFFTNFIITDDNDLYVWGASPQALRLQYQARKRARATQKQEDDAAAASAASAAATALLAQCPTPPVPSFDRKTGRPTPRNQQSTFVSADPKPDEQPHPVASSCDNLTSSESTSDGTSSPPSSDAANPPPPRSKSLNDLKPSVSPPPPPPQPPSSADSGSPPTESSSTTIATTNTTLTSTDSSEDSTDHHYPTLVDCTDVAGQIVHISSGLYHSALVTSQRQLYTWGKNLEKQLGRDRSQFECLRPTLLETVANAIQVECGADFTVCMSADLTVRAFGNSSFGQCGRDIAADKNGIVGKLVRLRISKRVVRIPDSTQCVEFPVAIALPRPQINLSPEPARYLKRVPRFDRRMVVRSGLFGGGGEAAGSPAETPRVEWPAEQQFGAAADSELHPNEFIHYCLFLFHGVYNAQSMLDRVAEVEFKVRILMLNYNVKEAFTLCLAQCVEVRQAIRTFEHFTKDVSVVPIQRDDLKFLINELFALVLAKGWPLVEVEQFLEEDMDHYLFALAYVLFFNNNNTDIERQVLAKFTDLFSDELNYNSVTAECLEKSEQIFAAVSTGFKAIVCQKLFEYEDNFA